MKKLLFSTFCISLVHSSMQENIFLSAEQQKLTNNYIELKIMERTIDISINEGTPLKINELKPIQRYLKKQIQKRKNIKKFLSKFTENDTQIKDLCKQELLKSLSHKKIRKMI